MSSRSTTTKSVVALAKSMVLPVVAVYATKRYPVAVVQLGGKVLRLLLTKKNQKALKLDGSVDTLAGKHIRFDADGVPVRVLKNKPRASKKK